MTNSSSRLVSNASCSALFSSSTRATRPSSNWIWVCMARIEPLRVRSESSDACSFLARTSQRASAASTAFASCWLRAVASSRRVSNTRRRASPSWTLASSSFFSRSAFCMLSHAVSVSSLTLASAASRLDCALLSSAVLRAMLPSRPLICASNEWVSWMSCCVLVSKSLCRRALPSWSSLMRCALPFCSNCRSTSSRSILRARFL
mmetsp:Transcript_23867/g.34909  ORF Transcript_23867/g.34909 Transcript_23867/m.34909 type:complete len:205 (-) Transcript_23867:717-1331(-)